MDGSEKRRKPQLNKMLHPTIRESPISFAAMKKDPSLLKTLGLKEEDDQILFFPTNFNPRKLDLTSWKDHQTDFYLGEGALEYVSQRLLETVPTGTTQKERVATAFREITQTDISLFQDLPIEAFPANHPFHQNGALELLKKCQQSLPRRKIVSLDGRMGSNHQVLLGCEMGQTRLMPHQHLTTGLTISYWGKVTLIDLFASTVPGYRVAFDSYGNIWASVQALLGILTGQYYLPTHWSNISALRQAVGFTDREFHPSVAIDSVACAIKRLQEVQIHPILIERSDQPKLELEVILRRHLLARYLMF